MRIALLMSRVRVEEKWLMQSMDARGLTYDRIDDGEVAFDLATGPGAWASYDVVLIRSLSYARGLYAAQVLATWGVPTINSASVIATCGDKLSTSAALAQAGVP